MTDHHDEAEARAERAEQEAGELQAKIDALQQHAEQMADKLANCADDLEAEIRARTDHLRGYPTYERKRDADLEPVRFARQALANWTAWLIDGGNV